jgi:trimeric autotransporter adhesin
MTTLSVINSISRPPLRRGFLLIPLALALAWLVLSPMARAVDPPPDGGYPNNNTAEGDDALLNLTTGSHNTAISFKALYSNTTGSNNTANGFNALYSNTTGGSNTAYGFDALFGNTTGRGNTANGFNALFGNTTGVNNTADGWGALASNTTGKRNIALGVSAGSTLTTGNSNIDIGNVGVADESSTIRIGTKGTHKDTFIAGINGVTVATGVGVIIGPDGRLGTVVSSARFKDAIKPMDKASEAILALKPVTFRYTHELDPDGIPQFGLVAEQVEKVDPALVARDGQGKAYTVRYEAVNAMLLNEFLKEHRKVEEQEATITQLKSSASKQEATIAQLKSTVAQQQKDLQATAVQQEKEIKALTASFKDQASQIQTVSDKVEMSKPAPQIVGNNQ